VPVASSGNVTITTNFPSVTSLALIFITGWFLTTLNVVELKPA